MKYHIASYDDRTEIEAPDAQSAAQQYVAGGDFDASEGTIWINVTVTPIAEKTGEELDEDQQRIKVAVDPDEPECTAEAHVWRTPYSILGGLKENPGCWGHGGGVIQKSVCACCGKYRIEDSWAQDMETGEQGLNSVKYEEADEQSEAWAILGKTVTVPEENLEAEVIAIHDDDDVTVRFADGEEGTYSRSEIKA